MSDSPSPLPARPSLEQLRKQAKELLRAVRAGDSAALARLREASPRAGDPVAAEDANLADAQFAIARQYGFESWARLRQHIESLRPSGMAQYEQLAREVAAAYTSGDAEAIREVNWNYGTSFVHERPAEKMQQFLKTWFASEARTEDLALGDARLIVAHSYGFSSWEHFAESVTQPPRDPRSAPLFLSSRPPFYEIDWEENRLSVRGPQTADDWETIAGVMKEYRIAKLRAGGMIDAGMEQIARLDHVTELRLENSKGLTDEGAQHLTRMPQLVYLEMGGWTSTITDRALEPLRDLTNLRHFHTCWSQGISDAGIANLAACEQIEYVDLMGTPTGDGAIRALAGKPALRLFKTGRGVTDVGIPLLHGIPAFKTAQGETELMIDGPFTDAGMAALAGLDGVSSLGFFWHCPSFTSAGLAPLNQLPNLVTLMIDGKNCDDEAMRHIAALPRLRRLQAQGTVASDDGFEALSQSRTIERIWGRECPNLTGRGFVALSRMPALRVLSVSCKGVDDASLAALPGFPSLIEFMPMDVPDEGFRHVGRCERLERLVCMYCRETGDAATAHIGELRLKSYYAGMTKITDRSLEILAGIESFEKIDLWSCLGITDAGIAHLARLPRLRELSLAGLRGVSRKAASLFPAHVRVDYSG